MEEIQIKPRNPSRTSKSSVLDVLESKFNIKVLKIDESKHRGHYIVKVNAGSLKQIHKEQRLQRRGNLQKWEFKLTPDQSATIATDQCILINITYSDIKAFKKLPTANTLEQKFTDAASAATTIDKRSLVRQYIIIYYTLLYRLISTMLSQSLRWIYVPFIVSKSHSHYLQRILHCLSKLK